MSLGCDFPDDGIPFDSPALRFAPRPVEVPVRLAAARRAMQRLVLARFAAAHYHRHGTVRAAAVRMGRREEWVRDLLVEAGVHHPRRRGAPAPKGPR